MATQADINSLIGRFEKGYRAYTDLEKTKEQLEKTNDNLKAVANVRQQLVDINSSTMRRQREELDTKKRIIDYTERDIGKNYSILSTQFILFIVISSMVLFMIVYALFIDSDVASSIKGFISSKIGNYQSSSSVSS